ncbi:putative MATE family efflux protein [Catenibacillus scindens]|uniref:Putative MATE family efflux protein n=1 Tax=Catenibacillus scindens TaxID=673271 RepID=A0A7W8H984_9FIRM|nr:MATE family efflux transporter [Catenibacillus scindens]MBB5264239.1 putative MATE family efflux protein [Catenibacillus scindens]
MIKDMTKGSPLKLIISFAIPMFLGILFQQFYSMVDTIIVGQFLGVGPLAGVGSTSSLNFMVIGFCTGVCSGFAIPVAQMFGARNEEDLRRFVASSAWLCVIFSLILTVVTALCCRKILEIMNTPEDIFEYAYIYILIIFLGIPFTFLYNIVAAIIRSLGDSRTPVIFLALASLINIVLDIAFIWLFSMNVEGPALATVISQAISGFVCLLYMRKKFTILKMSKDDWRMRSHHVKILCKMGIPMGLQYSVTAIGTLVIQAAVNSLGTAVVAGVTAAQRLNSFISCPVEALGQTMAPYSGQNCGAGDLKRVGRGLLASSLSGFVVSGILLVIVAITGRSLSLIFLDSSDPVILDYSYQFLMFSCGGYCLLTLVNTVRFTIQGMGFSGLAITAGVMEMAARTFAGLCLVSWLGFTGICMAHPLAWLCADIFLIPAFFFCKKKLSKPVRA